MLCSTTAAYPITEAAERLPSKKFPYAHNKARCEELLFATHKQGDLVVTSIRPGHTYGEGGDHLLHSLGTSNFHVDRLKNEQPIIVHGNGTSFWPTCHRDDVSVAFVGAVGNEKASGRGYHVAGEEWMTVGGISSGSGGSHWCQSAGIRLYSHKHSGADGTSGGLLD